MEQPQAPQPVQTKIESPAQGCLASLGNFFTGAPALLIYCVILPAAAFVVELATGICAGICINPIGGPWQVAAVASVPVCNLFIWLVAVSGVGAAKPRVTKLAAVFNGLTLVICLLYAMALLPLIVLGMIAVVVAFWYFGFGLLGLLPAAPAAAFLGGLGLRRRLAARALENGAAMTKPFVAGLVLGLAGFLLCIGHMVPTWIGANMYFSRDPETQNNGLRLLRTFGDSRQIRANQNPRDPFFGAWTYFVNPMPDMTEQEAAGLYYRVTGRMLENDGNGWMPFSRRSRFGRAIWDDGQGGERVGGILEGLSLQDSLYETRTDSVSGTAYAEWTMVFHNSWRVDREARARIALPPGAVVTRLTLWINGEPHEAAFGRRGTVRQAYERVVRRERRDPVLVETCGPDRIQLQCFPVPANGGTIKIRFGMAIPLDVAVDHLLSNVLQNDLGSAIVPAPAIVERNFLMPFQQVGLPASQTITLEPPASSCWSTGILENAATIIHQTARTVPAEPPQCLAVVIDTSRSMKKHISEISATLTLVPPGIEVGVWGIDDLAATLPSPFIFTTTTDTTSPRPFNFNTEANAAAQRRLQKLLSQKNCTGGRCNVNTLSAALDWAGRKNGVVLWIHGPQPSPLGSVQTLRSQLERGKVPLTALQVVEGPCAVSADLDGLANVRTLTPDQGFTAPGDVLRRHFQQWFPGSKTWHVTRTQVDAPPPGAQPAPREVAALWAAQEVRNRLASTKPTAQSEARDFAAGWHIVTPVSSAVVLENQRQYLEAGLKQVDESTVPHIDGDPKPVAANIPAVPEPEHWMLLAAAVAIVLAALWMRRRAQGTR